GFVVGAVAKLMMPGRDPGGMLITSLLGVGGALGATLMGRLVGLYQAGQTAGFIASVIGAFVLLLIYRLFAGSRSYAHF
ncbi:MAG: GlsB/YeaQ/YmgE family stress response membrane protein, partial [Candidatus Sericytochromatia bacterium]